MQGIIPELGNFSLGLALAVSIILAVVPLIGVAKNNLTWMNISHHANWTLFALLTIAMYCLGFSFVNDDFSVQYVASHSNSALPLLYKISAIWGGHEGSLLLWVYLLSAWMVLVSLFSKSLPDELRVRSLAILGLVTVGFLLFLIFTSNPFDRLFPQAIEGKDLNPLLQDPGLAIHPPMLYMGYVGFAVPFAFVIAALLRGHLDATWARWSRPWATIAWVFLTIGIGLGSFWAYYELGWGGWWFWDPVENASFMPWLMGTALLHSLAVAEKRGSFKSWVALLAIFTFSFSLLGTFLVRSGVLVSVHAFATDPERGLFILAFLAIVVLGSLALYASKVNKIHESGNFDMISKETGLLINNVLLVVGTLTVLIGTLYPLILDALNLGKLSVGTPYFNKSFVPIMLIVGVAMGFGVIIRWKNDNFKRLLSVNKFVLPFSIVIGSILPWLIFGSTNWGISLASAIAIWVIFSSIREPFISTSPRKLIPRIIKLPLQRYGMMLAHIGIGLFIIGATFSTHYSIEKDVKMSIGTNVKINQYNFTMTGLENKIGPNYRATLAVIDISKNGKLIATLHPAKRIYNASQMPMTEASINSNIWRDLYVAMGDPLDSSNRTWAMRVYYKPFIRFIWLGVILMALGGIFATFSKRYLLKRSVT